MKKNLKIALYDPYLDTLGGGERFILSIFRVFAENDAEITIFWNKNLNHEIEKRFNLFFVKNVTWKNTSDISSSFKAIKNLRQFDYFFYISDGSYFFSSAKKNYVYAMVPGKDLYHRSWINKIKLSNYKFITHSQFTQKWLKKFGINAKEIPFYLENKIIDNKLDVNKKKKIILSVGRFFQQLHSKRQDKAIEVFKNLKKISPLFADYTLVLAGGLKKEDFEYFNKLKKMANNDSSIIFKPNITLLDLYNLYRTASFYWHFTGYGIDVEKHPESVEHFGITPLEAAAFGDITFCYAAGGPLDSFIEGKTGFFFRNNLELTSKMISLEKNPQIKKTIMIQASQYMIYRLNYEKFKQSIERLFI